MGYYPESLENVAYHDSTTGKATYFHREKTTGEIVQSDTPNNFTNYNWTLFHPLAGTGHPEDPLYTREDREALARKAMSIDYGFKSVARTTRTQSYRNPMFVLSPKEQKNQRMNKVVKAVADSGIPSHMLEQMGTEDIRTRPVQGIQVKPMTWSRRRGGSYSNRQIELFDEPINQNTTTNATEISSTPIENPDVGNWLRTMNDPLTFIQGLADHDSLYSVGRSEKVKSAIARNDEQHSVDVGFEQLSKNARLRQQKWDEDASQGDTMMSPRLEGPTTRLDTTSPAYRKGIANHITSLPLFPGVGKETDDYAVKNYKVTYYEKRPVEAGAGSWYSYPIGYDKDGEPVKSTPYDSERKTVSVHVRYPKVAGEGSSLATKQSGVHIYGGVDTVTHEIGHALTAGVNEHGWVQASGRGHSPVLEGTADGFEDRFGDKPRKRMTSAGTPDYTPEEFTKEGYGTLHWSKRDDAAAYLAARVHAGGSDLGHRDIPTPKQMGFKGLRTYTYYDNNEFNSAVQDVTNQRADAQLKTVGYLAHHNPKVNSALHEHGYGDIAERAKAAYLTHVTDSTSSPQTYQEPLF